MKPLEGIRVLEMGTHFAAPMCGRILADWGAEVIKVEAPEGDPYRVSFRNQRTPQFEDGCPSFDLENANKQFLSVNAKDTAGQEVIYKLAATCDVFLTNNRLNAMKKLHLTYEEIKAVNPKIVYADMTGYGSKGPLKDKPGYDYTCFLSRSGMMADLSPKGESVMSTIGGFGDHVAALTLAAGISAALVKAKTTGEGEYLTTSLYQDAIFLQCNGLILAQYGREFPRDHFDCNSALLTCYKCKDGEWIYLAMPEYNRYWKKMCTDVLQQPELAEDPRFATLDVAKNHVAEAVATLDKIFLTQDSTYWVERMESMDMPVERLAHYKDVVVDEQAWANGFLREHTYAGGQRTVFSNTPVQFASVPDAGFRIGGKIGADTTAIMEKLGYTSDEIEALKQSGAVKQG